MTRRLRCGVLGSEFRKSRRARPPPARLGRPPQNGHSCPMSRATSILPAVLTGCSMRPWDDLLWAWRPRHFGSPMPIGRSIFGRLRESAISSRKGGAQRDPVSDISFTPRVRPGLSALHRAFAAGRSVPRRGVAAIAVQTDLPGISLEPGIVAPRHDRASAACRITTSKSSPSRRGNCSIQPHPSISSLQIPRSLRQRFAKADKISSAVP